MRWGVGSWAFIFQVDFFREQNLYKELQDMPLYFVTPCTFFPSTLTVLLSTFTPITVPAFQSNSNLDNPPRKGTRLATNTAKHKQYVPIKTVFIMQFIGPQILMLLLFIEQ